MSEKKQQSPPIGQAESVSNSLADGPSMLKTSLYHKADTLKLGRSNFKAGDGDNSNSRSVAKLPKTMTENPLGHP